VGGVGVNCSRGCIYVKERFGCIQYTVQFTFCELYSAFESDERVNYEEKEIFLGVLHNIKVLRGKGGGRGKEYIKILVQY
jgi:hypothetical protein